MSCSEALTSRYSCFSRNSRPACLPQSKRCDAIGAVSRNDEVVRVGPQLCRWQPAPAGAFRLDAAAEANLVADLRSRQFPRIAVAQPVVGFLDLLAIVNALGKDAEVIVQAIAEARHAQRGKRIEKARCQAAEATVAERGIGLVLEYIVAVLARACGRGVESGSHSKCIERVAQRASHQELDGEVVHAPGARGDVLAHGAVHPPQQFGAIC